MRAKKLTFLAGAGVLAGVSAVASKPPKKLKVASTTWRGLIDSHEKFSHDSIDHLGYDWERVGDPSIKPKHPFKVYIPRSTEDVVEAVKEVKELGQKLTVRSKGHSSNDLVLSDHGAVLLMQAMDNIIAIDEEGLTATVQGGAISALVDDHLAPMGLGLPVIGDHKDITVGGFASVGGISPGSHRFGMFIDNVLAIEFVDWDGNVKWCSKEENSEDYYTLLAGLGKHGVMTQLKLRLIKIDKYTTIWFNDQTHYRTMDDFIAGTKPIIEEPGDAMMERGVWADFALPGGKNFRLGQFSIYKETDQTAAHKARNNVSYGVLHSMGLAAGNLPDKLDRILKYVSITGVMASPKYASIKNIEFFTDKILDSTVGDPTRMLIVLGPLDRYEELFRSCWALFERYRAEHDAFKFISVYVKSIRSDYLARDGYNQFCELMFYVGTKPENMTAELMDEIVEQFDDIVIENNGYKYMHTRTSKDPEKRAKVDPNLRHAERRRLAAASGSNGAGQAASSREPAV
jgi:FAD binding domain